MLTLTGLLLLLVLRPRVKSLVELVVVTRPSVGEGRQAFGKRIGSENKLRALISLIFAPAHPPFSLECRATCLVARGLILGLSTFLALSNNLKFDVAAAMSLRGGEGTIAGGLESISHYVVSQL